MKPNVDAELDRIRRERKARESGSGTQSNTKPNGPTATAGLAVWNAGRDVELPPPRGWLLGNSFCRRLLSSLLGTGGVGKSALRVLQALALASNRNLTGEHIFQRTRVSDRLA